MSAPLRPALAAERGWALPITLVLLMVVFAFGTATLIIVDAQQRASGVERSRESALNLAEGVLSDETFLLSAGWPGYSSAAFPAQCTSAGTGSNQCPTPSAINNTYTSGDFAGATWNVAVYDDGGTLANYYSDSAAASQPHWDANGNNQLWVRASATVKGHTRTLVARVQAQSQLELFPKNVITAGSLATGNSGNKNLIDTKGNAAAGSTVFLRCSSIIDVNCLNLAGSVGTLLNGVLSVTGKALVQLSPWTVQTGYSTTSALSPGAIGRLRRSAKALGTYYASGTCPTSPAGRIVFIENANCTFDNSSGSVFNTAAQPGVLIVNQGTVTFNGDVTYHGIIYAPNAQNSSGNVVSLLGNSDIAGEVLVDGNGKLTVGDSGTNGKGGGVTFDANVAATVNSFGSVGIVENTWRELT